MTHEFKVGDRVIVPPEEVDSFIQPWRGRFEKARQGTVIEIDERSPWRPVRVLWDHKRGTRANWTMSLRHRDLRPAPAQEATE
jgi:hypothetical protein